MHQIHDLRREMIMVRKSVWPVRDLLASLLRIEIRTIQPDTRPYLRDVYDHTIQLIDTVENLRDLVSGLMELYLSTVSNRTNEVMKVLTIIATIFIPLTFLAGVYGMNFRHMPELEVWWAYPALWVVMIGVAVAMLAFFRRRGWL
jgi:magnesium transporter